MLSWVPKGHKPNVEETMVKQYYLTEHGESPQAFSFKSKFTANDV